MNRSPRTAIVLLAASGALVPGTGAAADAYGPARRLCGFADSAIGESSGVASASWAEDLIWTHNDSGDRPRFFAVGTDDCATRAVYDVAGAQAEDWEDMTRSGTTLYFADIGDNRAQRDAITVYDVPEPPPGAPSGTVMPSATRVFTYPDGATDAESIFVDPTTGRLVLVTKSRQGLSGFYRAPAIGDGELEKVGEFGFPTLTTGGDARSDRIAVRTYLGAHEWDVRPGDSLAGALARPPATVVLPFTRQGEAIAYTTDGSGLIVTSEGEGGPVHRLERSVGPAVTTSSRPSAPSAPSAPSEPSEPPEPSGATEPPEPDDDGGSTPSAALLAAAGVLVAAGFFLMQRRPRA